MDMSFKNYLVEAYSKAMSAELTSQQLKMIGDHFAKQYNVDVNNSSFEVVSPSKLSRDTDIFVYVSKNGTIYSAMRDGVRYNVEEIGKSFSEQMRTLTEIKKDIKVVFVLKDKVNVKKKIKTHGVDRLPLVSMDIKDKLNKINSQSQEAKKLISELKKYGAKVSYIQYDGRYIETDFSWKSKFYELYINVRPSSGEKKLQVYMNSTSYMPSVTNVADIDAILKDVQNMKKIVELLEEANLYKILYRM